MKKPVLILLVAAIQMTLITCATAVTFVVDHPPLVDLRGVNSITVIPFEWSSPRENTQLAWSLTSELLSGLKKGKITVYDPYSLEHIYPRDYWQYVDVYITGKIISARSSDQISTREEKLGHDDIIITTTVRTVVVDIEYTYIRAVNNEILGYFRKSEWARDSFERSRNRSAGRSQQDHRGGRGGGGRGGGMHGGGIYGGGPRGSLWRDNWTDSITASAVMQFSDTMRNELNSWTTIEKRKIKGRTGRDPNLTDIKKLVKQRYYGQAVEKYLESYERTGNISVGYNLSLLLQVNGQFSDALKLLENLHRKISESGKRTPLYIRNEILKLTGFINGFKILETDD